MVSQVHADLVAEGVPATIVRGRTAAHPWRMQAMCKEHETASDLIAAGVSPKDKLCKICPSREQCLADGYLSQETAEPGIYILSTRYLTLPAAPCKSPDIIIVDETHWQVMCSKPLDIFPEDIAKPFAAGPEADKARWLAVAETISSAVVQARILDAARAIGTADLTFAKAFLDKVVESLIPSLDSGLPRSEIRRKFKAAQSGEFSRARSLRRLVKALLAELDAPRPTANAVRLVKDAESTISTPMGEQKVLRDVVRVNRMRLPTLAARVPVVLLDASADHDINRRIWGERLVVPSADIRLERNAVITQATSATFSRRATIGVNKEDEAAAQRRREIADFVKRVTQQHGPTVVGTYKPIAEEIASVTGCLVMWFGNLRGQNGAKNCAAAVSIGREMPGDVEELARAVYATDAEPILSSDPVKQCRRYRTRSGAVAVQEVDVYPDLRVQGILEQLREREVEQFVDRPRLIHNVAPKHVFVLTSVVLDLTVDHLLPWTEMRDGGTRFQRAWRATGILPLGAALLHAAHPEQWSSQDSAEHDLKRLGKGGHLLVYRSLLAFGPPLAVEFKFEGHRGSWAKALINEQRHQDICGALTVALKRKVTAWRPLVLDGQETQCEAEEATRAAA